MICQFLRSQKAAVQNPLSVPVGYDLVSFPLIIRHEQILFNIQLLQWTINPD